MEVKDESMIFVQKSLRSRVMEYLAEHPTMSSQGLYFMFPNANTSTLRNYQKSFRDSIPLITLKGELRIFLDILRYKTKTTGRLSKEEKQAIEAVEAFVDG